MPFDTPASPNSQWANPNDTAVTPGTPGAVNDPLDQLKTGLRILDQSRMGQGFDVNAHHERMLTTGPFAEAAERDAVWAHAAQQRMNGNTSPTPMIVAQMSNANAQMQSDAMLSGSALPTDAASVAHNQVNQQLPGEPTVGAGTYKKQDLNALRVEHAAQDARNASAAKDASRLRRNTLMGLPPNTP